MTPEGKVKAKMKALLAEHGAYQFWPVPTGYGKRTVDCLACVYGRFVAIETKRPEVTIPTKLQKNTLDEVKAAKGVSLLINDDAAVDRFRAIISEWE